MDLIELSAREEKALQFSTPGVQGMLRYLWQHDHIGGMDRDGVAYIKQHGFTSAGARTQLELALEVAIDYNSEEEALQEWQDHLRDDQAFRDEACAVLVRMVKAFIFELDEFHASFGSE